MIGIGGTIGFFAAMFIGRLDPRIGMTIGFGLLALLVVFREDDDRVTRLLEFSLVLAGMIIASPHTQRRYFVALYVPAVVLMVLTRF